MAKGGTGVLLGFDDEPITEKYKNQLNFTVNKIGGLPDCPSNIKLDNPKCPLCQLPRPLVVQIYAPLESSIFHRTLYLFACINPNCWNSSQSWMCVRVQTQEETEAEAEIATTDEEACLPMKTTDWCSDADVWDDDDDNNANFNEENGNVLSRVSDEDDESCSLEDSLRSGFGNLTLDNDRNANLGAQGGAVGRLHSPAATAEIEGNEGEVISIDTPTFPQHDINALLQEVTPLPQEICQGDARKLSQIQFVAYFMSVYEEMAEKYSASNIPDRHVKELLQEYQQKNEDDEGKSGGGGGGGEGTEGYEKSAPAHGDKMFHDFLSKIQANPGQILRYSRDSHPLLPYRLQEQTGTCQSCNGETTFEFQLIPTIISKLILTTDAKLYPRLEFGTVLVYTCKKSCWNMDSTLRLETVIVQAENF